MKNYVIIAEKSTGKILHQDGSRYQEGEADYRVYFDNVNEARLFCEEYFRIHPDREYLVLNDEGICLHAFG